MSFSADIKPLFRAVAISHMQQFGVGLDNYLYMSNPDNANACSRCYRRTMAGLLPCRLADGKISAIDGDREQFRRHVSAYTI